MPVEIGWIAMGFGLGMLVTTLLVAIDDRRIRR